MSNGPPCISFSDMQEPGLTWSHERFVRRDGSEIAEYYMTGRQLENGSKNLSARGLGVQWQPVSVWVPLFLVGSANQPHFIHKVSSSIIKKWGVILKSLDGHNADVVKHEKYCMNRIVWARCICGNVFSAVESISVLEVWVPKKFLATSVWCITILSPVHCQTLC